MNKNSGTLVPPMLYLPTIIRDEVGVPVVVNTSDGRVALPVYTALDRLADNCGTNRSWMLVATEDLGRIRDEIRFDVVGFDLPIPPRVRDAWNRA